MKLRKIDTWLMILATVLTAAFFVGCNLVIMPDDPGPDPMDPNSGVTGKFAGSDVCISCHTNTHGDWQETLHATALDALKSIGQETNAECLPCHTVGFGEDGGYVDEATTLSLANVGCESCHGAARDHVDNVGDESMRPIKDISAEVCGACHTGSHHPNFDEWQTSNHATVTASIAQQMVEGNGFTNACGVCHSGDVVYRSVISGETVGNNDFAGMAVEDLNGITCVICHDPHAQTGNATEPGDGRDFQLRWPEVANPTPTNTVQAATDSDRFNLCGQCHHSRGQTWQSTSRGPHDSIQANVYLGEMPSPVDENDVAQPLVVSRTSIHALAPEQCATCHMYRQDFQDEEAPAIAGHSFEISFLGCATSGCHPSQDAAQAAQATLIGEVQTRLDDILIRLGDPAEWEYTANDGPEMQGGVSDELKQIRFLYYYVIEDGSFGVHNPRYVRDILSAAEDTLTEIGR
ncbi:MAG: multiheme c-type cytochrome [Planctomycetota bacterium]|jgi:formate-dependent nitrite reductase cytochrome c552 subunit